MTLFHIGYGKFIPIRLQIPPPRAAFSLYWLATCYFGLSDEYHADPNEHPDVVRCRLEPSDPKSAIS